MKRINLKVKRIKNKLSQKELAEKVGVKSQTISDYESGRINPSFKKMKKIAKELDSTVDELFFN